MNGDDENVRVSDAALQVHFVDYRTERQNTARKRLNIYGDIDNPESDLK